MQFSVRKDLIIVHDDGARFRVDRGTELFMFIEVVLHPLHKADEPLFDQGHSRWMFKTTLESPQGRLANSAQTYFNPHDLWKLLVTKRGESSTIFRRREIRPMPAMILEEVLYCSNGDRRIYPIQLLDHDGSVRVVNVLDKYCGFCFGLQANAFSLFWECRGGITFSESKVTTDFSRGFVFECAYEEFLSLPAYEPDTTEMGKWRRVFPCAKNADGVGRQ